MIRYQMKSETDQLNLRVDKILLGKLQELADKFNKRSKTQVAVEILEQYIELWEQVEDIKFKAIRKQKIALTSRHLNNSDQKSVNDKKLDAVKFTSEREVGKEAQKEKEKENADPKPENGAK